MTAYILPTEIWMIIFEFCREQHAILRLVCKEWNKLLSESRILYKSCFTSSMLPWALDAFPRYEDRLLDITATLADISTFQKIHTKYPDLRDSIRFTLCLESNCETVARYMSIGYSKDTIRNMTYEIIRGTIRGDHLWFLKKIGFGKHKAIFAELIGFNAPREVSEYKILKWYLIKLKRFYGYEMDYDKIILLLTILMKGLCMTNRLTELKLVINSDIFKEISERWKKDIYDVSVFMKNAAHGGNLDIIIYLHEVFQINPTKDMGYNIMMGAIHLDDSMLHEHIIQWLYQTYHFPDIFNEDLFMYSVRCASTKFLNWLMNVVNCNFDRDHAVSIAIWHNHIDNLQCLHENGIEVKNQHLRTAMYSNASEDIMNYLTQECGLLLTDDD